MGLLIVDKATGGIHSHRVQAIGNVPPLTLENCFPPWERATIRERYEAYETPFNYSTQEAKDNLRIVAGQVHYKPIAILEGQSEVKEGDPYSLNISVVEVILDEEFTEIKLEIEKLEQFIPLTNNQAELSLVFEMAGEYSVRVVDDRFRLMPTMVIEVLEVTK